MSLQHRTKLSDPSSTRKEQKMKEEDRKGLQGAHVGRFHGPDKKDTCFILCALTVSFFSSGQAWNFLGVS